MAQQFGTASTFGLTFETGVITDSIGYSYSNESKVIKNGTGDVTGKTYFNEAAEVTYSGFLPTASPYATAVGSAITLSTALPDFFSGAVGTDTIAESVSLAYSSEDYQRVDVSATHHPLIV